MRFGIVYYGTEAKDRGLDQLSQCLIALGHEPFIVTRKPKYGKPITKFNGVPVLQVPSTESPRFHFLNLPLPVNWMWKLWITRLSKDFDWDGIFVRETPLAWPGTCAARELRIPVYLDMRENLSAMYAAGAKERPANRILRSSSLVRYYESLVLPRFDHLFTSTYELGEWAANAYGISPEKISTLGNYPSSVFLDLAERALAAGNCRSGESVVRMVHTGYVKENRGLQNIIEALKLLDHKGSSIVLRIIGEGSYLQTLKEFVIRLGVEKQVEFVGMLPPEKVPEALVSCDVGVCAYLLNEQTHQTLPGKLFEYMSVGLPVLSSARKTVTRIVEEAGCGMVYQSRRPEDIADCILKLAQDSDMRSRMGQRGKEWVAKRYNWRTNLDVLASVVDRFSRRCTLNTPCKTPE